ncbi:MAG: FAD-dependent oxidoreductase [Coriobacteriales bacterium]
MSSKYKHVFEPIEIRGIDFKNRIVLAPPSANHTNTDHMITHEFVDWFRQFARGGVTTLYSGNASIDINECKDEETQLDLSSDNCVLPMSWYAEMGKEYDCHASLEINHNGHNTAFETVGHAPFSASPMIPSSELSRAKRLGREPVQTIEMDKAKIEETVNKYGDAAMRMKRAGMDIVLVHGGHGNLIAQFTSPMYNHRTDEYGGSTEKRARFALEVLDNIRQKCGDDFVIEYRISADEIAPEGMHFDETLKLIDILKDKVDIFNVSAGLHSDFDFAYYRNWCQNWLMPHGFNVHFARDIKKAFPDVLVDTVGSINDIELAEHILSEGWADFVAMSRPLIADPDMPRKYAEGRPKDRRPCLRCDQCAVRLEMPRVINCAVNPFSGLTTDLPDGRVPIAEVKKKCAVIGGGPAGIVAALTLEKAGHDVTLYEKTSKLGGQLICGSKPEFKGDLRDYLKYLVRQAKKSNVNFKMKTEATPEMLKKKGYDAVIIAIGAVPTVPDIPGIDRPNVAWAPDAEEGKIEVGEKVVILGAGPISWEAALDFALQGKDVTLLARGNEDHVFQKLFVNGGPASKELVKRVNATDAKVVYETQVTSIEDGKVLAKASDDSTVEFEADTVLYSMGLERRSKEAQAFRHCAPETSVRIVGDCKRMGGNISAAVNGAFQAAIHI